MNQKFDIRKEVNQNNFSLGQRKLLVVLIRAVKNLEITDKAICNLTCKEIYPVINLFQKHLSVIMMC